MKITHLLIASLAAATVSSCSILSPKKTGISGATATQVNTTDTKPKNDVPAKAENVAERIAGEWIIISAAGKSISDVDDIPYITFDPTTNRFYASNGCNVINGSYSVTAPATLQLTDVLSTMKMCPETDYEAPITTALSGAEPLTLKINKVGQESFLRFYSSKGTELISARKHNMDFLNGNWQIMTVGGKTVKNEDATLFIDIRELKIHGNTGCNFFNGEIFINPDKTNAIDFSRLASTRMACPDMEQESAILLALEETATAIRGSEGRVMFLNPAGKELMTIKSVPAKAE